MDNELTTGGIALAATILGGMVGMLTKFMLDRRKLAADIDDKFMEHIQERVKELESENKDCMKTQGELKHQVGILQGKIERLELELSFLKRVEK